MGGWGNAYGQPDCKISVFFTTRLIDSIKILQPSSMPLITHFKMCRDWKEVMNLIGVWRSFLFIVLFATFFGFFGFSTITKYLKRDVQVWVSKIDCFLSQTHLSTQVVKSTSSHPLGLPLPAVTVSGL